MKKLVFVASVLFGLSQATGCIITSDDDDDFGTGDFQLTWTLTSETGGGCDDAGATDIWSYAQLEGALDPIIDKFDCIDGTNITAPLPAGDYTVWVEALDINELLVAQSDAVTTTLLGGETVGLTFGFPTDTGAFGLTWTLTEDLTDLVLTCTDVVADGVSVLSTPVNGGGTGFDEIWDCIDGQATTTQALPLDDYTVVVSLLDPNDVVLGASEPRTTALEWGNDFVDLGNFDFVFDPL